MSEQRQPQHEQKEVKKINNKALRWGRAVLDVVMNLKNHVQSHYETRTPVEVVPQYDYKKYAPELNPYALRDNPNRTIKKTADGEKPGLEAVNIPLDTIDPKKATPLMTAKQVRESFVNESDEQQLDGFAIMGMLEFDPHPTSAENPDASGVVYLMVNENEPSSMKFVSAEGLEQSRLWKYGKAKAKPYQVGMPLEVSAAPTTLGRQEYSRLNPLGSDEDNKAVGRNQLTAQIARGSLIIGSGSEVSPTRITLAQQNGER